jgi:hypothetical protein
MTEAQISALNGATIAVSKDPMKFTASFTLFFT